MNTLPDMTDTQISQHILNGARRELDSLISKRDWYVAGTHHPFLPVALWRTYKRNRAIINLNRTIDAQRDYVERLEDEMTAPIAYRINEHAAAQVLNDKLFDLVDELSNAPCFVDGVIDGRSVMTVDDMIVVYKGGFEQYRAEFGNGTLDHDAITLLAVTLDGTLNINHLTLEAGNKRAVLRGEYGAVSEAHDPDATDVWLPALKTPALNRTARAVLDYLMTHDLLVSGEIDGAVITSEQCNGFVRMTAYENMGFLSAGQGLHNFLYTV